MSIRKIIIWILLLIVIDQAIKIVINSFFLESQFEIIPSLFEFKPFFNTKHSYPNSLLYEHFNIDMGLWFHGILFLIILIVATFFLVYVRNNIQGDKKLLDLAYIFLFAAAICSISGNFIWEKGVLDFIYLKPFFIFDLKDLYANCFVILFLIYYYKNRNQLKTVNIKNMFAYLREQLRKTIRKENTPEREQE